MRRTLYQHLTNKCQSITTWKQPYQADATTPKPYGVIKIGERPRSPFNRRGSFQDVRIWLYFSPGSYIPLDEAGQEVKALLSDQVLTRQDGGRFLVEWNMDGGDFYDDELKALAQYIDFVIPLGG